MGIIDTIKQFFQTIESSKEADKAIAGVKKAAQANNYTQASLKAFYALEKLGEVHVNQYRDDHQTAREYAQQLVDEGLSTEEELEPIIVGFEVAKYSEGQVSFDDYATIEQSLETVASKFKSGDAKPTKKKRSRRRKPRKGGKTGAARSGRKGSRSFRRKE